MNGKRIYRILVSAGCILLAALLAAGAVGICREGIARQAEDPMANIYTAENVTAGLGRLAPLFFAFLGLLLAGALAGMKAPERPGPESGGDGMKRLKTPKRPGAVRAALLAAAVVFILAGILNGSAFDVLAKAINLCTECVGLG